MLAFMVDTTVTPNKPTLAVLLNKNGANIQTFYCEKKFKITFPNNDWPGEGKGVGPGGTKPFQNDQVYESGAPVGGKAVIMLKFRTSTPPTKQSYKFNVEIAGCSTPWDPRIIPD